MCEFLSWVEKDKKIHFLTPELIYSTPRGKALQKFCQSTEDYLGHGAIKFYFDVEGGENKECTDFSIPDNFPPKIVKAIKSGDFKGFTFRKSVV